MTYEERKKKEERKYDFESPPPETAFCLVQQIISCLKNPDPDTGLRMTVVGALVSWLVGDLQRTHAVSREVMDVIESERYKYEVLSVAERIVRHGPDDDMSLRILREVRKLTILLVDGRKKLREYEQEYGVSWSWHESVCYPSPPYVFGRKPHMLAEWIHRIEKVSPLLDGVWEIKSADVVSSSDTPRMDVVSLLTLGDRQTLVAHKGAQKGGERIVLDENTFKGKHVLVCCVNAPVLFASHDLQSLLNLCNELSSERDDVEMVMVARMNIVADEEKVFDHLFSGFLPSCLAVPYEDWERRESILKQLNCSVYDSQCFLFNPSGLFVTSFMPDADTTPCGAEAFPFTEDKVLEVLTKRKLLRSGSLENLLRPYESSPADVDVYELIPKDRAQKEPLRKHISDVIKGKHVGLYLCCNFSLIPLLCKLYEHCNKQENEAFEIVVLYLPYPYKMDPDILKKNMEFMLLGQNIRWWFLPFNNSVSLRFFGLTMDYNCYSFEEDWQEDKLIIVGGNERKILDMYGAEVIRSHGIDGFYPFTRDALVKKKKRDMEELRLDHLLEDVVFRGDDPDQVISVHNLLKSKKKIIIYMGEPIDSGVLVSLYKRMEEKEFEVVFIESPGYGAAGITEIEEFSEMPWYVQCPLNGDHTSLAKKLKEIVCVESLVGFQDGRACSVHRLVELFSEDGYDDDALGRLCSEDYTLDQDINRLFSYSSYRDI